MTLARPELAATRESDPHEILCPLACGLHAPRAWMISGFGATRHPFPLHCFVSRVYSPAFRPCAALVQHINGGEGAFPVLTLPASRD